MLIKDAVLEVRINEAPCTAEPAVRGLAGRVRKGRGDAEGAGTSDEGLVAVRTEDEPAPSIL